jgi:prepilin-type N-terminal cleavage/methylation domain-containing protein
MRLGTICRPHQAVPKSNFLFMFTSREQRKIKEDTLGKGPCSGFTLLELLLAILLLSFLGFAVFTGINLCIKVYRSQIDNASKIQQLRLAWRYLERSLSSAGDHLQTEGPWPYFIGEEQEVRFLTPLPLEAHNLGGYYFWRVWIGKGEDGWGSLVVDESRAMQWSDNQKIDNRQVLLSGLRSWQFVYSHSGKEYAKWNGYRLKGLPLTVRVRFTLGDNVPQEWLIPIHTAAITSGHE